MKQRKHSFCQCHKLTPGYPGSPAHETGWVERLLLWLLPHFDIIKEIEGPWRDCDTCDGKGARRHCPDPQCHNGMKPTKATVLYLRRFYVFRSEWLGLSLGDLYIHKIYRSDDDPDPHDHPWDFRTFVLWGGYRNEVWVWDAYPKSWGEGPGERRRLPWADEQVRMGHTRYRTRKHVHRVILDGGRPAWTLVKTSNYHRTSRGDADWYFITEKGPVFWRKYLGLDKEDYGG